MRIVLGFLSVLIFTAGLAQADLTLRFFTTLPDVPLVNGVFELPEQSVSFDKPEGRIIESYAVLKHISPEEVKSLYNGILPSFGWKKASSNVYIRENEALTLYFGHEEGQDYLRVLVAPR